MTYSFIGGVAVTAGWMLLRQNADLWIDVDSTQKLLELTALAANIVMTIAYRQRWSQQRGEVSKLQALRLGIGWGTNEKHSIALDMIRMAESSLIQFASQRNGTGDW
jgi:hypothetical protein